MKTLRDWLLAFVLLALMSFSIGCGTEPAPEVVARLEVCTVTLHDDGTVSCKCEVKAP